MNYTSLLAKFTFWGFNINMQVGIYKSNLLRSAYNYSSIPIRHTLQNNESKYEEMNYNTSLAFKANVVMQKTITSQVKNEKQRLVNKLKEILETEVLVLSEQEKLHDYIEKNQEFLEKGLERRLNIANELNLYLNSNSFTKQTSDRINQLKKEFARLNKQKYVIPPPVKPSKDNYDYVLINKFKNAILDGNYDLDKIEEEHYSDLESINTIDEFKKKYISLRIPSKPEDVIVDKILKTLDVGFYCDLDDTIIDYGHEAAADFLMDYFENYFSELLEQFPSKTLDELMSMFCTKVTEKALFNYEQVKVLARHGTKYPLPNAPSIARFNEFDAEFLDIDYDKFVIDTIKKIYLERKKINEIKYEEGGKTIELSSIKTPEYRFEKIPEKMKRFIQDAKKIKDLERSYEKYTNEELKNRLNNYGDINIEESEEFFNVFLDFNNCKFTDGDRIYCIKFLRILDKISDGEMLLGDALAIIKKENIKPFGTIELNAQERKRNEEEIKLKHKKMQEIASLKKEFNNAINNLYELNLSYVAEKFSKYYPSELDSQNIETAKRVIKMINESLALGDAKKINTRILRLEMLDNLRNKEHNNEKLASAFNYAKDFELNNRDERAGQYLLNRNIIENYPDSMELFTNKDILERIVDKLGSDVDAASIALCKYEDYLDLGQDNRSSILNLIDIFDIKNSIDKVVLKDVIENDYINSDTIYHTKNDSKQEDVKTVILSKCKKEIYEKYKFPNCVDYFKAFELAMRTCAAEKGFAGIKKTGLNNNSIDYKMELKIKNYTDRLFSSKNDYVFDIYSEKGLH